MRKRGTSLLFCFAAVAVLPLTVVTGGRSMPRRRMSSTTTPMPSTTVAYAGARGKPTFRRFHANDSHVGKSLPCTRDEKICFRYNLVFDPTTDRCQPVGGGFAPGCVLTANRTEFQWGSGHLVGLCRNYEDPCPGHRMAYDGRCYRKEIVRDVICGCDTEPTLHFLGGVECRCTPSTPIRVLQPPEDGRCRVPDFRFPDANRTTSLDSYTNAQNVTNTSLHHGTNSVNVSCSTEQSRCFSQGKVWVAARKYCFVLLETGPCENGYVLVLNRDTSGRLSAICLHVRGGCPPGSVAMASDGQCRNERETVISVPGRIAMNVFGAYEVLSVTEVRSYTPTVQGGNCVILQRSIMYPPRTVHYHKPLCNDNDKAMCHLFDMYIKPPSPE